MVELAERPARNPKGLQRLSDFSPGQARLLLKRAGLVPPYPKSFSQLNRARKALVLRSATMYGFHLSPALFYREMVERATLEAPRGKRESSPWSRPVRRNPARKGWRVVGIGSLGKKWYFAGRDWSAFVDNANRAQIFGSEASAKIMMREIVDHLPYRITGIYAERA